MYVFGDLDISFDTQTKSLAMQKKIKYQNKYR